MDKKAAFLILTLTILLSLASADDWWNYDWSYRVPIYISAKEGQPTNAYVRTAIDFSQLFSELKVNGRVSPDSIRVFDSDMVEQPIDIEGDWPTYSLSMIVKGKLTDQPVQYYLYFDTVENDPKSLGRRITRNVNWFSGYEKGLSVSSPDWQESWAKLAKVSWRWCTDTTTDKAYLFYGTNQFQFVRGRQSNMTTLATNHVKAKFDSPAGGGAYCTDNGTKYGVAVEFVQFFPVENFNSNASVFASLGSAEFVMPPSSSSAGGTAAISIIGYAPEVGVEMGWTKDYEVTVKNTGAENLNRAYVSILGIPTSWYRVSTSPSTMTPGEEKKFIIQISPPVISRSQTYQLKLSAFSREVSDQKDVSLKIFTLQSELLRYGIEKANARISQVDGEASRQDTNGMNVTAVSEKIADAKTALSQATTLLDNQRYSQVSDYTLKAEEFTAEAESRLSLVGPKQRSFWENTFIVLAILAVLLFAAAFLIFFRRTNHAYRSVRSFERAISVNEIKKEIQGKESSLEDLKEERERTQRFTMAIGNQHRQGLLSDEAYQELKANAQNKMKALDEMIGGK